MKIIEEQRETGWRPQAEASQETRTERKKCTRLGM
jgi:hypothetical protein